MFIADTYADNQTSREPPHHQYNDITIFKHISNNTLTDKTSKSKAYSIDVNNIRFYSFFK